MLEKEYVKRRKADLAVKGMVEEEFEQGGVNRLFVSLASAV